MTSQLLRHDSGHREYNHVTRIQDGDHPTLVVAPSPPGDGNKGLMLVSPHLFQFQHRQHQQQLLPDVTSAYLQHLCNSRPGSSEEAAALLSTLCQRYLVLHQIYQSAVMLASSSSPSAVPAVNNSTVPHRPLFPVVRDDPSGSARDRATASSLPVNVAASTMTSFPVGRHRQQVGMSSLFDDNAANSQQVRYRIIDV